jgi:nucleoside-diphosphate-sugar epimerase
MKTVVIGGTRFLGRSIVRGLLKRGHEVTAVHRGQTAFNVEDMQEVFLDKTDREALAGFLRKADFDVVMDTILSADDLKFIIPLLDGKIKNYVHCGSTGVYAPMRILPAREDDPCDPPDELGGFGSKLEQDQVLLQAHRETDFPATILRPSNIYGPGDIPLDIWGGRNQGFFKRLCRGDPITVPNDGKALLQPGYVEELGDAFSLPLEHEEAIGQVYNISSQRCVTLNEYLSTMKDIVGSSSPVEHMPVEQLSATYPQYFGAWPAGLKFLCEHMSVDVHKAMDQLGFSPRIPLEEGLRRNLEWMREENMVSY